jgi:transposase
MTVASETTLPNSIDELKGLASALIERLGQHTEQVDQQAAQLKEQSALIEKLKFGLARLRRWRFGKSNESLDAEQLALWAAELDGDILFLAQQRED